MPIYEYECTECGCRSEAIQKVNAPRLIKCKKCGGKLRKLISSSAIQFKGSGWYITDYARKTSGTAEAKTEMKAEPKDGTKADSSETAKTKPEKPDKSAA